LVVLVYRLSHFFKILNFEKLVCSFKIFMKKKKTKIDMNRCEY
jgi:hypothetical protein